MAAEVLEQKKKLREQLKQKLDSLDFTQLIQKSTALQNAFERLILVDYVKWMPKKYAVGFYPFDHEPQINLELSPLLLSYARITSWKDCNMLPCEARRDVPGIWEELEIAAGVTLWQPDSTQPVVMKDDVGMILVPGLGFDLKGFRLGRGKGFYDRFLRENPAALRVGVAFQEQVLPVVPCDPWDEPLDIILTDGEVVMTESFRLWQKCGKTDRS